MNVEIARQAEWTNDNTYPAALADNDNRATPLSAGRSVFPHDAVARIVRPSRSVATSGPAPKEWRLVFESRSPSVIEPLMGYTGSRDTLKQVELRFPTLTSATRYAERQGLAYVLQAADINRAKDMEDEKASQRMQREHSHREAEKVRSGVVAFEALREPASDHLLLQDRG